MRRWIGILLIGVATVVAAGAAAYVFTPWPKVLLVAPIENTPDEFAAQIAKDVAASKKLVDEGVVVLK